MPHKNTKKTMSMFSLEGKNAWITGASYGIGFNSVDIKTLNGFRYKQGYLEVRLRIVRPSPNGDGETGIPAVWSFTQDKALEEGLRRFGFIENSDTDWVELDWLEYWGVTKQWKGGYYTTTFHDSTTLSEEPFYSNSNHSLNGLGHCLRCIRRN